jgi:putative oxidoreductase
MFRWYGYIGGAGSVGLLVLRLVAGAAFVIYGWPKIQNATTWMNAFPNAPPPYLQAAAAVAEFGGGIAWIAGFLTPLFSLMIACTMATAIAIVHLPDHHPFIAMNIPGQPYVPYFEPATVFLAIAICLLLVGPGQFSIDCCIFGRRTSSKGLPPYAT